MKFLKHIGNLLAIIAAFPFALALHFGKHHGKDILLIGERQDQACDNGFHLFRYIRKNHSEYPVFYVIARGASDLRSINNLGNIIFYGEFRHYVYWLAAHRLANAHMGSCVPDTAICWSIERILRKHLGKKIAFLQHGISKENIPELFYSNTKFDLFVCGAAPEAKFVSSEFGYPKGTVQYLGFPRFDALHTGVSKKQILVMPTWRKWLLVGSTWGKIDQVSLNQFKESRYFKTYQDLINSPSLLSKIEDEGYQLIFFPHHEMQRVVDLFTSPSKNVTIANEHKYKVQQLLLESTLLVTDFSSIAFDFAYMRKPVVYFQFDRDEYEKGHYAKGYFDYARDGFGPVVDTVEGVTSELSDFIGIEKYRDKQPFLERQISFFPLHDSKNCERTFQVIKTL
jgi:CDP-glycerol glycerophosphotransferase